MSTKLPPVRCTSCGKVFRDPLRFDRLQEELQHGVSEERAKELVRYQPEFQKSQEPVLEERNGKTYITYTEPYDAQPVQQFIQEVQEGVFSSRAAEIALNALNINRFCCRASLLQAPVFPAGAYYYNEKERMEKTGDKDSLIITPSGENIGDSSIFRQVGMLAEQEGSQKRKKNVIQLEGRRPMTKNTKPMRLQASPKHGNERTTR